MRLVQAFQNIEAEAEAEAVVTDSTVVVVAAAVIEVAAAGVVDTAEPGCLGSVPAPGVDTAALETVGVVFVAEFVGTGSLIAVPVAVIDKVSVRKSVLDSGTVVVEVVVEVAVGTVAAEHVFVEIACTVVGFEFGHMRVGLAVRTGCM